MQWFFFSILCLLLTVLYVFLYFTPYMSQVCSSRKVIEVNSPFFYLACILAGIEPAIKSLCILYTYFDMFSATI